MFTADFEIEYELHFWPKSKLMLANPLVMFMITFRDPPSTRGRKCFATSAGPTTLLVHAKFRSSRVKSNALSSPGFCAQNDAVQLRYDRFH